MWARLRLFDSLKLHKGVDRRFFLGKRTLAYTGGPATIPLSLWFAAVELLAVNGAVCYKTKVRNSPYSLSSAHR